MTRRLVRAVAEKYRLRQRLRGYLRLDPFPRLRRTLIQLNDYRELQKVFGWHDEPVLDDPSVHEYRDVVDVNQRRLRDAETLATVVRNSRPAICLDIGTGLGHSAARMAANAPQATIYTVNVPREEYETAGELRTMRLEADQIGAYYRQRGFGNVVQILADTARWQPDIGPIDVALVDGCHDTEYVVSDSETVLARLAPGGFILWHDFNPGLVDSYDWIRSVCAGVETLLARGFLRGPIFLVRDSWTGVHRVAGSPGDPRP